MTRKKRIQPPGVDYNRVLSDPVVNAVDSAWQKREQFEQFQQRLEDILLQEREDAVLKNIVSPGVGRERVAAALRRYHVLTAEAEPMFWIREMLVVGLELVDWERLAERIYPELTEQARI